MVEALRLLATRNVTGLDKLSDEEIVAMCQKELPSDVTAYRELLRRYEGLVYNTCNKILNSRSDAEEVAQDVLIQVFHKINQFEGRSQFKTWLYKIVHNYCNNRLSKIIRKRQGSEKYQEMETQKELARENEHANNEVSDVVQESINQLKDSEREVLTLKFMSGLTIQEIANVMDIGLSAAKMRLYRAMESFKEVYTQKIDSNQNPYAS